MFAKTVLVATLAVLAKASPCKPTETSVSTAEPTSNSSDWVAPFAPNARFGLMAIRSGSNVHYQSFGAVSSNIFAGLSSQNTTCDAGETRDYATFFLSEEGELYLHTDNPPRRVWVDRSGMGQGNIGYTTGAQSPPANAETTAWEIDEVGDVTFNGASLIACPDSIDGSWSIWVSAGVSNPAGNQNCEGIVTRAVEIEDPIKCSYTF